jgi:hypothetical protein
MKETKKIGIYTELMLLLEHDVKDGREKKRI